MPLLGSPVVELGLYSFADRTADPETGETISPSSAAARPARGGRAADQLGLDVFGRRRAPPARLRRLGAGGRARRGRGAHHAHPAHERRLGPELGRSRARVPGLRHARPALGRPRRDHGRPRLVHRVVPAVRLRPGATTTSCSPRSSDCCSRSATSERVTWSGRHRAPLDDLGVYPRPAAGPAPVWVAVGGNPESAIRAGTLGLPMALAIIGGLPERFAPFAELHRRAGAAGRPRPAPGAVDQLARLHRRNVAAGARRVVPGGVVHDEPRRPRAGLAADDTGGLRRGGDAARRELRREPAASDREDPLPARDLRARPLSGAVQRGHDAARRRSCARSSSTAPRSPRPSAAPWPFARRAPLSGHSSGPLPPARCLAAGSSRCARAAPHGRRSRRARGC